MPTVSRFFLPFLTSLLLAGCGADYFSDKYDKTEMQAAMAQARSEWETFRQRALKPQPGDEGFNVKVRLTDGKRTEHIWLADLQLDKEPYVGTIVRNAEVLDDVRAKQLCKFTREEVSDWMYRSNGKVEGNFTLRVLLKDMPPEKAAELKAQSGWQ